MSSHLAKTKYRDGDDFYRTPPEAVEALLRVESFQGDILEPACGDGAISRILEERGHEVRSTDLVDRGYGLGGIDFLDENYPYRAANIVTNPPFKLADQFIERATSRATSKVALLLRLALLEGERRSLLMRETRLSRVWVLPSRLKFLRGRDGATITMNSMLALAWFVWDKAPAAPTVGWASKLPPPPH